MISFWIGVAEKGFLAGITAELKMEFEIRID